MPMPEEGTAAAASGGASEVSTGTRTIRTTTTNPRATVLWALLLLNFTFLAVGAIGGPLLLRLYYRYGGARKWIPTALQNAGFPILLPPLAFLYSRAHSRGVPAAAFFIDRRLLLSGATLGLLLGFDNYMFAAGMAYLPVSTASLLFATQLAFTAGFAFLLVRQRFTPYSINAVVLLTMGSVLLGLGSGGGDRPDGVSGGQYLSGFLLTLGSAALLGFILPSVELAYSKSRVAMTYASVLQFQVAVSVSATTVAAVGMLVNNDFKALPREAERYEHGEAVYYCVLLGAAIIFQLVILGSMGIIFYASSLFSGVCSSLLLPFTEIAGVMAFREKFSGEKGMALVLCLWGFASYFYGEYRSNRSRLLLLTKNAAVSAASPPPQPQAAHDQGNSSSCDV